METADKLKEIVREKYGQIATQDKEQNAASCCGATMASDKVYNIMTDDYSQVAGYESSGDLGLGCGLPTAFAQIQEGHTVIDLGSGAGNDCFIARHETGPSGKVIGIDFTPAMIDKARINAEKLGFNNVEFRQGDIEEMPVSDNVADVVVSNCVLNLVPNKAEVMREVFRVLKPGAHFSISDIVLVGALPESLQKDAELYAGCVSGAIQKTEYLELIQAQGFTEVTIQKEKIILLPDDILTQHLTEAQLQEVKSHEFGIFSVTVFAKKPGDQVTDAPKIATNVKQKTACLPNSGCC